jgi:hypothetical protein
MQTTDLRENRNYSLDQLARPKIELVKPGVQFMRLDPAEAKMLRFFTP